MPHSDTSNQGNQYWEKFLANPKFRIVRHLIILFFLGILVMNVFFEESDFLFGWNSLTMINIGMVFFFWGIICLNIYVLIPNYLYRGKYGVYFFYLSIGILLLLSSMTAIIYFTRDHFPAFYEVASPNGELFTFYFSNFLGILFYILAVSITVFLQRWIAHSRQWQELEKNKVQMELIHLRDQIQPDFLSRMLNTANVLAKKDADKASSLLLQLSRLLRYQLYDSTREKVLLGAEISFLKDYMNLEKLHDDKFTFHVSFGEDTAHVLVPPLLFIPIVERATRHLPGDKIIIYLLFQVDDDKLYFVCIYPGTYANDEPQGLEHLRKRLHLLYGNDFRLETKQGDKNHVTSLQICL